MVQAGGFITNKFFIANVWRDFSNPSVRLYNAIEFCKRADKVHLIQIKQTI